MNNGQESKKGELVLEVKLVIAEKPSVAMSLAAVLGANEKKDGYLEGGGYLVSWCVGHLLELESRNSRFWTITEPPTNISVERHTPMRIRAYLPKKATNTMACVGAEKPVRS